MVDTRKFDNKIYEFSASFGNWNTANAHAENLRKQGYYVRVIEHIRGYKRGSYSIVWKRKKR